MFNAERRQTASRSQEPHLELEVISDPEVLRSMDSIWQRLIERAELDHPFMCHEWLLSWWECFGTGRELYVIAVRNNGNVIALAPLMIRQERMHGVKIRRIEAIYNEHTPRYDFIIGSHHDLVYRAIWEHLRQQKHHWDIVLLSQIPAGSRTLDEMARLARAACHATGVWSPPASPYIDLGRGLQEFSKTLKGHHRRNVRSRHERLSAIGPVTMEVIASSDQLQDGLRDAMRIEAAAWKGRNGTAIESDPAVTEFYLRFAQRAAERGWLRLFFLKLGDRRIAVDYALSLNQKLYGVKIGYDPEFHTYSPSNLLLNLIVEQACIQGEIEYDFLGADDQWKQDWTRMKRSHEWLYIFQNNLRGRFIHNIKFSLIPAIQAIQTAVVARTSRSHK